MRTLLTLAVFSCALSAYAQPPVPVALAKGHIYFELPNDKWKPSTETDSANGVFFFKREAVKDAHGRSIIPAIMVFVEDAKKYDNDLVTFSINKRGQFEKAGLHVDQMLMPNDKDYPLTYRGALFLRCSYTQQGLPHVLYMIHYIDKYHEAIQVYLDMTKELGERYDKELMTTVRSLRER